MGDFSDCIGLFPGLLTTPAPEGDGTDDRLGTGMDMEVLDGDALLTLSITVTSPAGEIDQCVIRLTLCRDALGYPGEGGVEIPLRKRH